MQDKFTDVLASILLKVYDPNIKILKVIGCIISLWPLMSVIWFICWSVGWFDLSVCHNFLKVTLPCAFLCTYVLPLSVKTSAVLCYEYQCWKQSTLTFLVRKLPGKEEQESLFLGIFIFFLLHTLTKIYWYFSLS